MSDHKTEITEAEHLTGLALFTMASQHYAKAQEYEAELAALFGYEATYSGNISDAMIDGAGPASYNDALRKEGITVVASEKKD